MTDFDEASRILDHDLSGTFLPDRGAHERPAFRMIATGSPMIGSTLTFQVIGPSGVSIYAIGLLNGAALVPPFGFVTAGDPATMFIIPTPIPVGVPLPIGLPPVPALAGLTFGVQTLTIVPAGTAGNVTNLHRATVGL